MVKLPLVSLLIRSHDTLDIYIKNMKHLIYIILLLIIPKLSFSQKDCIRGIIYKGEIKSEKYQIIKIKLPTTDYLSGYNRFESEDGNRVFEIDLLKFSYRLASHMSSEFCGESNDVINRFFKKVKFYPIKLYYKNEAGKMKKKNIKIPLDNIKFSADEDGRIIIEFPSIQI